MWKVAALWLLVSCTKNECEPHQSIAKIIVAKCGMPPQMNAWEASSGLPGEGQAQYVAMSPEVYRDMIDWRDCAGRL
jgi:hypothetical protein